MTAETSYRQSHATPGYGARYSQTYSRGYYYLQWQKLELPILVSVLKRLAAEGLRTCLDFACGTGRILAVDEGFFPRTVGVDVSADMLGHAKDTCRRSELICVDITKERLVETFDLVTAFRFFLNAEPALRESALQAIAGSLRQGGALVANVHINARSPLGIYYRLRNSIPGIQPISVLGHREFKALLGRHGLRIEETHWYSYLPRTGWYFEWVPRLFLERLDKLCRRLPRRWRGWSQSFLVVARKI